IFNQPSRHRISASSLSSLILQNDPLWLKVVTRFKTSLLGNVALPRVRAPLHDLHLYGVIGTPSVMSRTIIAGTDENTVCRILFVLSYFIRCNEIFERSEDLIPLELQREEECKTSLNCDKNLSSESTPSDGKLPHKKEAETRHKRVMIDFPFTDISVENFLDVPMPKSQIQSIIPDPSLITTDKDTNATNTKGFLSADELFVKSYGRSLMAGYCEKYMSDFVLMGLPKLDEFQDSLA
ncbi:6893_t:CDS:2, partial [Racocetra persica]